jgi:hypothetical protein
MMATFRFYKTLHPPMDRSQDKGLVDRWTLAIPVDTIAALPLVNPSRDLRVRKPRRGEVDPDANAGEPKEGQPATDAEPGAPQTQAPDQVPSAPAVAAVELPPPDESAPTSDAQRTQSRDQRAMARAQELASRLRSSNRFGAGSFEVDGAPPPPSDEEGTDNGASDNGPGDEGGVTSVDGVRIPPTRPAASRGPAREVADTPEMVRAQRRALERIRKMGLSK